MTQTNRRIDTTLLPDVFKNFHKSTIGFDLDPLFNTMKSISDSGSYPPYNIIQYDAHNYAIELAVAGFNESELSIDQEHNILKINGKKIEEYPDDIVTDGNSMPKMLYSGIATRAFERRFALAENVEVKRANLENGILRVHLEHHIPESMKPKKIAISSN